VNNGSAAKRQIVMWNERSRRIHINAKKNGLIHQTMMYIEKNYRNKELNLQNIADAVFVSPNYLSYLFKKIVNINLWDYVTKLRMEEGKRLILTTDKRRYEIADEIGYESPEHFGKIFKKYYGRNLSEIKNNMSDISIN
jgi:two-component system, response regulator YesN